MSLIFDQIKRIRRQEAACLLWCTPEGQERFPKVDGDSTNTVQKIEEAESPITRQ